MLQKYLSAMVNLIGGTLGLISTGSKVIQNPPQK